MPAEVLGNVALNCRTLIFPGMGLVDPDAMQLVLRMARRGSFVLLESCAGFLNPADFASHQTVFHRHLNLAVGAPVDLWEGELLRGRANGTDSGTQSLKKAGWAVTIPYVEYVWPHHMKVRDFSRVVPVKVQSGEAIGWINGLPVAVKVPVGKGTLIYLGSPLGPALGAGDREARRWLRSVMEMKPERA